MAHVHDGNAHPQPPPVFRQPSPRAIAFPFCRYFVAIEICFNEVRYNEVYFNLDRLCDLRLVERVVPVHEERQQRSRNALYVLKDHYVAFWYRYVDRLRHLLGLRRYEDVLQRIRSDFDKYVSEYPFEDVCRQFLWQALDIDSLPEGLDFDTVGSWWISEKGGQDQLDVVAMNEKRAVLVGKCKWTSQPVDRHDLNGLQAALYRATPI